MDSAYYPAWNKHFYLLSLFSPLQISPCRKRYFINSDKLEDERREERRRRRQLWQRRRRQAGLGGESPYSWWDSGRKSSSFVDADDAKPSSAASSSYGVGDRVNSGLRKTFGDSANEEEEDQDDEEPEDLQPLSRGEKKKYVRLLSAFR